MRRIDLDVGNLKKWNDKQYLYPISQADVLRNPKLGQNPGW
ncbi:MAG: RagB/SusD family nutrient uptake outer membrane protein [Daejeonella sp.]